MSSKREKFYLLCRKLWTASAAVALTAAFFISGSQFTSVAHAQGVWDDSGNYVYVDEDADLTFTSANEIVGNSATVRGKTITVTGGEFDVGYGALYASGSLSVNNSAITQKYTGILDGLNFTINNSQVTQGLDSRITGGFSTTIEGNSTVKQGTGGTIETKSGDLNIKGSAKVEQGDGGSINTEMINGGSIILDASTVLQGDDSEISARQAVTVLNGANVTQGNDSIVESLTSTITINTGGQLFQGNDSKVSAQNDIAVTNGVISQGLNGQIFTTGAGNLSFTGGSTIEQLAGGTIRGNGVTISGNNTTVEQGDDSELSSIGELALGSGASATQGNGGTIAAATNLSVTSAAISQGNDGVIQGNTVTLSGAVVNQAKDGTITGDTITIGNGTVIHQEYGLSTIISNGNMTVTDSMISQSAGMSGSGGIHARLHSGGLLTINGTSQVTQGGNGRISGNAGVVIHGSVAQGDSSTIETLSGNNITIGGSVVQGHDGQIRTTSGGKLDIQDGAGITQGDRGRIVNADLGDVTFDGTVIRQGSNSELRTGGDLTVTNSGSRIENIIQDSNSLLAADSVTLDNAGVTLGTGSQIRLASNGELNVINGSLLNLGGMSSIVSEAGGASAFHKIHIGANSEIHTNGLLTFNNDLIRIDATGKLASTGGVLTLTNGTKVYGDGSIISTGLIVTGGSILSPGGNEGGDIGTLHIFGPLMITSSGILEINVDGGCDLIVVSDYVVGENEVLYREDGDVLLGGRLRMSGEIDNEAVYTILQAEGTITGKLSFDDDFFVADQWIVEEDGWQYLQVGAVQEKETFFADRAETFNQTAAGRMLDNIGIGGNWWAAKSHLNQLYLDNNADFLRALDTISGGIKANSLTLYRENPWRSAMDQFAWDPCGQLILGGQNRFCPNTCQRRAVWATPYYTEAEYRTDGNAGGYSVRSVGFQAGFNKQIDQKTVLGIFFGYSNPELKQDWDKVDMDDFTIGLTMGGMVTTKVEWKAVVAGGFQSYSMKRYMNPTLLGNGTFGSPFLTSDFDGNTLFASIELARPIYLDTGVLIRPLVAFESENVWQKGFSESGSIYALEFDRVHNDRTFVRTGLNAEVGARNLTLLGRAFYSHQMGGSSYSQNNIRFASGGNGFERVRGVDLERNFATFGAGGKFYLNPLRTQTVAANYDATVSAKSTSHAIVASFTQLF